MNDRELEAALDRADQIHVLGADVATNSGAVLFRVSAGAAPGLQATRGGRTYSVHLLAAWRFRLGEEWRIAGDVFAEFRQADPLIVAWEDQYLGKNPRSMATVVAARARFLFAVELRALQRVAALHDVAVNTMSWQSKVLGKARGRARATIKATSDERAPQIAAMCGSALRPQGDEADATCIGLHEIARHFTIDLAAIRGESGEPAKRRKRR